MLTTFTNRGRTIQIGRAPRGGIVLGGRAYRGGQFVSLGALPVRGGAPVEERNPDTAIVGLKYQAATYDGARGCFVDPLFAEWVDFDNAAEMGLNRKLAEQAGFDRMDPRFKRIPATCTMLEAQLESLAGLDLQDFDQIADIDRGGLRHGGGELDAAGFRAALALVTERKAARAKAAADRAAKLAGEQAEAAEFTECMECGARFAEAWKVRSHGMGCDRCGC